MNSKYENLKNQLNKAFLRFQEILGEKGSDIVRDSAIQRFEFTFELAWKTLKVYLEEKSGARDLYFPKDTFRSAFQAGLIDDNPIWLEMVDTRNKASHLYNDKMAEEVYKVFPEYLPLIKKLIEVMD
jgi:nucleotidyltransferase substrate binding protein (TIGR01987 family)